jgi:ribosomal protein S18 acetylase RimI-like enzyme
MHLDASLARRRITFAAGTMNLEFREKRLADLNPFADIGATAEEESSRSRALLLKLGIQIPFAPADLLRRIILWECADESLVVGHCSGDLATGEVLSLSVVKDYEGRGIGRKLLSLVVGRLRAEGVQRIWLVAPVAPALRAFGFYRALGWRSTGEQREGDSEVLELPPEVIRLLAPRPSRCSGHCAMQSLPRASPGRTFHVRPFDACASPLRAFYDAAS